MKVGEVLKNVTKIDGDYIEALLNRLVNDYDMSWMILSNLFGVEEIKLRNYKKYEYELFNDFENWNSWTLKALMLDSISLDSSDFRYKIHLKVLIDGYNLSTKSIAKFSNIDEQHISDFLNGKGDVPIEIKYKLGSCITQLLVVLKNTPLKY